MHWCMDETLAVLAMIPFIGYFFGKLHAWWHKHFHHKCHEKDCNAEHVQHCSMPAHIPHGKVGEGQCEQHPYSPYAKENWHKDVHVSEEDMKYLRGEPAPLKITIPNIVIWDPISQEDIEERFGRELVEDLKFTLKHTEGFSYTDDMEILWLVNDQEEVQAEVGGKTFVHDYSCCEHGWNEVG